MRLRFAQFCNCRRSSRGNAPRVSQSPLDWRVHAGTGAVPVYVCARVEGSGNGQAPPTTAPVYTCVQNPKLPATAHSQHNARRPSPRQRRHAPSRNGCVMGVLRGASLGAENIKGKD